MIDLKNKKRRKSGENNFHKMKKKYSKLTCEKLKINDRKKWKEKNEKLVTSVKI